MSVLVNNWTQGTPLTNPAGAVTGTQSLVHIPACRVFVKAADSTTAAPIYSYTNYSFKTNGVAPSGWTDLGTMAATGKFTYNKTLKKIQTGIDNIVQMEYVESRDAMMEFDLRQMDDYILQKLGFNASTLTPGSVINFQIGQEDIVQLALLMVYANKIDSKEIHWYHPSAKLSVSFKDNSDEIDVSVQAEMTGFTAQGQSALSLVSTTIFA